MHFFAIQKVIKGIECRYNNGAIYRISKNNQILTRAHAEMFLGGNAKYLSSKGQFKFTKNKDDWFVETVSTSSNDSFYNGKHLKGKEKISNGDKLGVGNASKRKIVIEFEIKLY